MISGPVAFGEHYFGTLKSSSRIPIASIPSAPPPKLWELCSFRCDNRTPYGSFFAFAKDETELGLLIWKECESRSPEGLLSKLYVELCFTFYQKGLALIESWGFKYDDALYLRELTTPTALQSYPLWQAIKQKLSPAEFIQLYSSAVDDGKSPIFNSCRALEPTLEVAEIYFPEYGHYYRRWDDRLVLEEMMLRKIVLSFPSSQRAALQDVIGYILKLLDQRPFFLDGVAFGGQRETKRLISVVHIHPYFRGLSPNDPLELHTKYFKACDKYEYLAKLILYCPNDVVRLLDDGRGGLDSRVVAFLKSSVSKAKKKLSRGSKETKITAKNVQWMRGEISSWFQTSFHDQLEEDFFWNSRDQVLLI